MGISTLKRSIYAKFLGTGIKYRPTEFPDAAITDPDSGIIAPGHLFCGDQMPAAAATQKYHDGLFTGDSGYTTERAERYYLDPSRTAAGSGSGAAGVWLSYRVMAYHFFAPWDDLLTRASNVLTFTATPADGSTVTISPRTYTFRTAPSSPNEVLIDGGSLAGNVTNLARAINNGNDAGTSYITAVFGRHGYVNATTSGAALTVTANTPGRSGNSISVGVGGTLNATWANVTLTGGGGTGVASGNPMSIVGGAVSSSSTGYYDDVNRRLVGWAAMGPGATAGGITLFSGSTNLGTLGWPTGQKAVRLTDIQIPPGVLNATSLGVPNAPGSIITLYCRHEKPVP